MSDASNMRTISAFGSIVTSPEVPEGPPQSAPDDANPTHRAASRLLDATPSDPSRCRVRPHYLVSNDSGNIESLLHKSGVHPVAVAQHPPVQMADHWQPMAVASRRSETGSGRLCSETQATCGGEDGNLLLVVERSAPGSIDRPTPTGSLRQTEPAIKRRRVSRWGSLASLQGKCADERLEHDRFLAPMPSMQFGPPEVYAGLWPVEKPSRGMIDRDSQHAERDVATGAGACEEGGLFSSPQLSHAADRDADSMAPITSNPEAPCFAHGGQRSILDFTSPTAPDIAASAGPTEGGSGGGEAPPSADDHPCQWWHGKIHARLDSAKQMPGFGMKYFKPVPARKYLPGTDISADWPAIFVRKDWDVKVTQRHRWSQPLAPALLMGVINVIWGQDIRCVRSLPITINTILNALADMGEDPITRDEDESSPAAATGTAEACTELTSAPLPSSPLQESPPLSFEERVNQLIQQEMVHSQNDTDSDSETNRAKLTRTVITAVDRLNANVSKLWEMEPLWSISEGSPPVWSFIDDFPTDLAGVLAVAIAVWDVSGKRNLARATAAVAISVGNTADSEPEADTRRWLIWDCRGRHQTKYKNRAVAALTHAKFIQGQGISCLRDCVPRRKGQATVFVVQHCQSYQEHLYTRALHQWNIRSEQRPAPGSQYPLSRVMSPATNHDPEVVAVAAPKRLVFLNIGTGIRKKAAVIAKWMNSRHGPSLVAVGETGWKRPADRVQVANILAQKDIQTLCHDPAWDSSGAMRPACQTRASLGVALFVRKSAVTEVIQLPSATPGILWAKVVWLRHSPPTLIAVVYMPTRSSVRDPDGESRASIWAAMASDADILRQKFPSSPLILVGDLNANVETVNAWIHSDPEEENPWCRVDSCEPTFRQARPRDTEAQAADSGGDGNPPPAESDRQFNETTIDHVLYIAGKGWEPKLAVQEPPIGLTGSLSYHRALHVTLQTPARRSPRQPRCKRKRSRPSRQMCAEACSRFERPPRPQTPPFDNKTSTCLMWRNFAESITPAMRLIQTGLKREALPISAADGMNMIARCAYNAALSAFGPHPAEIPWIREQKYGLAGPTPEYLPPSWLELANERFRLTQQLSQGAAVNHSQPEWWTRKRRRVVVKQMNQIWKFALEDSSDAIDLQGGRSQWQTVDKLMLIDRALSGTLAWPVGSSASQSQASKQNSRVSPEGDPAEAACIFRHHWFPKFGAQPVSEKAIPLTKYEKDCLPQMETIADIDPRNEAHWVSLNGYVTADAKNQRTDAATAPDGFDTSWRSGLARWMPRENATHPALTSSSDIFVAATEATDEAVTALLMKWLDGSIPDVTTRYITPISKPNKPLPEPGEPDNPAHYRPVAWSSRLGSWMLRAVNLVLRDTVERNQLLSPQQLAFRQNAGPTGTAPTIVLHTAAQRIIKYGAPTYVASLDLQGAFDTVDPVGLGEVLKHMRFGPRIRALLMSSLQSRMRVRVGSLLAPELKQVRGVPQGHPASPTLFSIFLERVIRPTLRACEQLYDSATPAPSEHGMRPQLLCFADDITLLAPTRRKLLAAMEIIAASIQAAGMQLNAAKTQYIIFGRSTLQAAAAKRPIVFQGVTISPSSTLTLLGVQLHADLRRSVADKVMTQKLRRAAAWTRRSLVSSSATPHFAAMVFTAKGIGAIQHMLMSHAPATERSDWQPDVALRQGLRSFLQVSRQTSSALIRWELQALSLWERAMIARKKSLQLALTQPVQAAMIRQMIDEQLSLQEALRRADKDSPPLGRLHMAARDTIRAFPEIMINLSVSPLLLHVDRQWFQWYDNPTESEISPSPLRDLHARDTAGHPPTAPQWKYIPAGEGARLLAQLRHGRCLRLADTKRRAYLLWSRDHDPPLSGLCEFCRVLETPHHLARCVEPSRMRAREEFVREWVIPLGIGDPTPDELMALMVGEAPHRCSKIPMESSRRGQWRALFHVSRRARRRFGSHLAKTLEHMLHPFHSVPGSRSAAATHHDSHQGWEEEQPRESRSRE